MLPGYGLPKKAVGDIAPPSHVESIELPAGRTPHTVLLEEFSSNLLKSLGFVFDLLGQLLGLRRLLYNFERKHVFIGVLNFLLQ